MTTKNPEFFLVPTGGNLTTLQNFLIGLFNLEGKKINCHYVEEAEKYGFKLTGEMFDFLTLTLTKQPEKSNIMVAYVKRGDQKPVLYSEATAQTA